jgi:hypothetical protein
MSTAPDIERPLCERYLKDAEAAKHANDAAASRGRKRPLVAHAQEARTGRHFDSPGRFDEP